MQTWQLLIARPLGKKLALRRVEDMSLPSLICHNPPLGRRFD